MEKQDDMSDPEADGKILVLFLMCLGGLIGLCILRVLYENFYWMVCKIVQPDKYSDSEKATGKVRGPKPKKAKKPPPPKQVERIWADYENPEPATMVCRYIINNNYKCPLGKKCPYAHPDRSQAPMLDYNGPQSVNRTPDLMTVLADQYGRRRESIVRVHAAVKEANLGSELLEPKPEPEEKPKSMIGRNTLTKGKKTKHKQHESDDDKVTALARREDFAQPWDYNAGTQVTEL
jgi:hypothetical protein